MNHLLASLTELLHDDLGAREVEFPRGTVLQEFGAEIPQVVFPHSAVVSAVLPLANGTQPEAGLIGCEGMVGFEGVLGGSRSIARWVVQLAGRASVVTMERALALAATPQGRRRCEAFAHAFLSQVMQTVACNTVHPAPARFARWLLLSSDRAGGNGLAVTQDLVSQMLGLARPRVSLLAKDLQQAGLIRRGRGTIEIADRDGLERRSCECYSAVRRTYDELLPYKADCSP